MQAVVKTVPKHEYYYFGDTVHAPFGNRTETEILKFTHAGVNFLFRQGCDLVIIACNTASSQALPTLQQNWLRTQYPKKKLLGVIIPTIEECGKYRISRLGIIGTQATIASGAYERELKKAFPNITSVSLATPELVPLIETKQY